ncbi:MAG: pyruvate kinase alpha/beta domain-containing protein [Promethearchaeota archaeon]
MVDVLYFEKGGVHTKELLEHVKPIIDNIGIKDVVVATTRGETGILACQTFDPKTYNLVCVTHATGFTGPNKQELKEGNAKKIRDAGAKILTATHAFGAVESGISKKLGGGNVFFPVDVFARLVRLTIGDGVKVCMEIALMAADAGLVPVDKDILCIAGTGVGADTACIIRPANSRTFPDLRLKQILAKPEVARP